MVPCWEWGEVKKALLKAFPFTDDLGGSGEVGLNFSNID